MSETEGNGHQKEFKPSTTYLHYESQLWVEYPEEGEPEAKTSDQVKEDIERKPNSDSDG